MEQRSTHDMGIPTIKKWFKKKEKERLIKLRDTPKDRFLLGKKIAFKYIFKKLYAHYSATTCDTFKVDTVQIIGVRQSWVSFLVVLVVKNPPASTGDKRDLGSIPGLGRSPGEGNSNPLQYSCLENPTYRGACS